MLIVRMHVIKIGIIDKTYFKDGTKTTGELFPNEKQNTTMQLNTEETEVI